MKKILIIFVSLLVIGVVALTFIDGEDNETEEDFLARQEQVISEDEVIDQGPAAVPHQEEDLEFVPEEMEEIPEQDS